MAHYSKNLPRKVMGWVTKNGHVHSLSYELSSLSLHAERFNASPYVHFLCHEWWVLSRADAWLRYLCWSGLGWLWRRLFAESRRVLWIFCRQFWTGSTSRYLKRSGWVAASRYSSCRLAGWFFTSKAWFSHAPKLRRMTIECLSKDYRMNENFLNIDKWIFLVWVLSNG